jgi:hypothetical protein
MSTKRFIGAFSCVVETEDKQQKRRLEILCEENVEIVIRRRPDKKRVEDTPQPQICHSGAAMKETNSMGTPVHDHECDQPSKKRKIQLHDSQPTESAVAFPSSMLASFDLQSSDDSSSSSADSSTASSPPFSSFSSSSASAASSSSSSSSSSADAVSADAVLDATAIPVDDPLALVRKENPFCPRLFDKSVQDVMIAKSLQWMRDQHMKINATSIMRHLKVGRAAANHILDSVRRT